MRFCLPAQVWAEAVSRCAAVLPKKDSGSALSCLRVCAAGGSVSLCGSDGAQRLELALPAEVTRPGTAFVPGAQAGAQSEGLEGDLAAEIDGDDLVLDDGRGQQRVRLAALPAGAFPDAGRGEGEEAALTVPGAALARLVKLAAPAAGLFRGAGGSYVEGLTFDLLPQELGLVALSPVSGVFCRHESAACSLAPQGGQPAGRYVAGVPQESARALLDACKARPGELRVTFTPGRVWFEAEGLSYASPRLAATPLLKMNWREGDLYVPQDGPVAARVEAGAWLGALKRAAACQRPEKDSQAARLTFAGGALRVTCRSERGAGEGSCPAEDFKGDEGASVAVNGARLRDHLRAFGDGPLRVVVAKNVVVGRDRAWAVIAPLHDEPT